MKGQEGAGRGIPTSGGESAVGGTPNDRLDSWKDIAEYLKRDVRTVVRWAIQRGLPVHRIPGSKRSAVHAHTREIDAWMSNGHQELESLPHSPALNPGRSFGRG